MDECRICELFGGPHREHAGWNGVRERAAREVSRRFRSEQEARKLTAEIDPEKEGILMIPETLTFSDDDGQDFLAEVEAVMSQPVIDVWSAPIPHDSRAVDAQLWDTTEATETFSPHPIVEPGWVYAPQAERGAVPAEPGVEEVDRLLTQALADAYVGQTVRLTVVDADSGESETFSVVKRDLGDVRAERLDRVRELERRIRRDLQEGDR
jgi:hypothetical protein